MATYYEIPTIGLPQSFSIQLSGVTYNLRLLYQPASFGPPIIGVEHQTNLLVDLSQIGGWVLDISDANNNPLACGIPLVTGTNLLAQYRYLNIGGAIVVSTDGSDLPPTQTNLGTSGHLYFVVSP